MIRKIFLVSLLCATAGLAQAQDKRAKLDGFYNIPFGAKLDETKAKLGPSVREGEWVNKGNVLRLRTLTILDQNLRIGGRPYFVTYYFGPTGMTAAAFVSKFETNEEDDVAACYKTSDVMKELIQRYGNPDSQRDVEGDLFFVFAFKDGGEIDVKLEADDNECEMRVAFRNAEGKKIALFDD